jgi:hypothetical protein
MSRLTHLEPWLDKKGLAAHLGCGERWIEYRMQEGMPAWKIAGREVPTLRGRALADRERLHGAGRMSYALSIYQAAPAMRKHPGARHRRTSSHAR